MKIIFNPTPIVKELLSAHPTNDTIWDNTNSYNVSFDTTDDAEVTTSIHVTKESTLTTTISMSNDDDESWFDAHEEFDSWYNTSETMDNYKEWDKQPNILQNNSINNESPNKLFHKHIEPDFYISEIQT